MQNSTPIQFGKILCNLPQNVDLKDAIFIKATLQKLCDNFIFQEAFKNILDVQNCINFYQDETSIMLTLPISLKQKEGVFDAELELNIFKDNNTITHSQFVINCANEITYDRPLDTRQALKKFFNRQLHKADMPKNSVLIYSNFLHQAFFAVNRDYCLFAQYQPNSDEPIIIKESNNFYSYKALTSFPEYMPLIDSNLPASVIHNGGLQKKEFCYSFDADNKLISKSMAIDTFFRYLREYKKYTIYPAEDSCTVERQEIGIIPSNKGCQIPLTTLQKTINSPIQKLWFWGDVHQAFEKSCTPREKSKLVANSHFFNGNAQVNQDAQRPYPIIVKHKPKRQKISYEENKRIKAERHDKSILWHKSHQTTRDFDNDVLSLQR